MIKSRIHNLVLAISLMAFNSLIFNCHSSSNTVNLSNPVEDTLGNFIDTLIKTKVAYEKSVYFSDSLQIVLRNDYFSKIKRFKNDHVIYIQYINEILNSDSVPKNKIVQFSYIPRYLSTTPKCTYIGYSQLLKLLLYNLESVQSDTVIFCKDELLKYPRKPKSIIGAARRTSLTSPD